ncbi:hypothetical protein Q9233_004272 [Columba guinea]|nr:hypothetical protein Q9233_004272 [Columba guinea]
MCGISCGPCCGPPTEEDVETPERIEETPERIADSPSKIAEEDAETPGCIEQTLSKPTEEDVEAPQSPEENSTIEDGGEEGAVDCDTPKRVQIQQTDEEGARWLGWLWLISAVRNLSQVSQTNSLGVLTNKAEGDQLPAEHTVSQDEMCNSRTLKAGTLEKLVENLLTVFGDNDFKYISIFLSTYRAFASTSTVLELLLDRYGNLEISGCKEAGNQNSPESATVLRTAIASILRAWLDQCIEDFQEPPDYICLMKVLDYLKRNIPGSDPEKMAQNVLEQFQKEELENYDGFHSLSPCNLDDEEELEISSPEEFSFFQEEVVAEQLTYMDVGVTQGVLPYPGTLLTDLMMLDTALQTYLEEFELIAQIKLLQFACNSCCMTPDDKFLCWFRRQQHLSDEESFRLSCEIEASADTSITSAQSQKSVVKRFSLLFLGLGVNAHSTPIKAQPKPAPRGSSGDSTITIVPPTSTPEEPQHKLPETSSSRTTDHTTDTSSVGVSCLISSPPLLPSDAKCSKKCPNSVRPITSKEVPPVQPVYNQQNGDSCHHLDQPRREKHNLESGSAAYELVQIISEDKELVIPPKANVFYAMNTQDNFNFILRRKAAAKEDP